VATEKYKGVVVFAGTTEGHRLARFLKAHDAIDSADFCVATEYGRDMLSDIEGLTVLVGRMKIDAMESLFVRNRYCAVIDATHPYATAVSSNIVKAASSTGLEYIRVIRREDNYSNYNLIAVDSACEAVKILNKTNESFLLTTGTKELDVFRSVDAFEKRTIARVLPSVTSLKSCLDAGLRPDHIICMQGPFSREMNLATMKQYGLQCLVTKVTGQAGGFSEKVSLAEEGYNVIVIGRPINEQGVTPEEAEERLRILCGLQ